MSVPTEHIPTTIQLVAPTIKNYGYLAVFGLIMLEDFGVPSPGETTLIAAAFFSGIGDLNIFIVIIIAILGAVLGDNIGYAIGYFGGHPLVLKFGKYLFITKEKLEKAENFFNRHGGKIVALARFVEGLRQVNGIIAGLSDMTWKKFLVFNSIGATLWVILWSLIGYFAGQNIDIFLKYQLIFSIGIGALIVLYLIYRIIKKKRSN